MLISVTIKHSVKITATQKLDLKCKYVNIKYPVFQAILLQIKIKYSKHEMKTK